MGKKREKENEIAPNEHLITVLLKHHNFAKSGLTLSLLLKPFPGHH